MLVHIPTMFNLFFNKNLIFLFSSQNDFVLYFYIFSLFINHCIYFLAWNQHINPIFLSDFSMINAFNNSYTKLQNSIFYYIYSFKLNIDIVVSTSLTYIQSIPSQINIFKNISWPEREGLEMFNILFKNKLDTRQLLLDFFFLGFPLLKTFSLSGYTQIELSVIWGILIYILIVFWHGDRVW